MDRRERIEGCDRREIIEELGERDARKDGVPVAAPGGGLGSERVGGGGNGIATPRCGIVGRGEFREYRFLLNHGNRREMKRIILSLLLCHLSSTSIQIHK